MSLLGPILPSLPTPPITPFLRSSFGRVVPSGFGMCLIFCR